ncbi:hypothetical protein ACBJ59_54085 [Nonomuraea sp. MTCD27]|uniref:hypothetical protein n=1 Tax=Nonomuraea sp. MTCD27 TaxID=1676747 RepID=UPI0035C24E3B
MSPGHVVIQARGTGRPVPAWAVLERRLIDELSRAVVPYLDKYTRSDGSLIWRAEFPGRDGLDDGYEAYWNWPLAYLVGADDLLLQAAARGWEGVTAQFERYGQALRGYERGYDWFHQGEGNMLLYGLARARPDSPELRRRLAGFADLFVDPRHGNYDPEHRAFLAPHVGSGGARTGPYRYSAPFTDDAARYDWSARHEPYGLPLTDVPGIETFEDLLRPGAAARMGEEMNARMGRGDVAVSLTATGLVGSAYLATRDEKYRRWVIEYVGAWMERAQANGGLVPDNVGTSGVVGEYHGGRWYGGLYGWSWPHGLEPIASAALVAASVARLLTGEDRYFELPRAALDVALDRARVVDGELVAPHRYRDGGWFDELPIPVRLVSTLELLTGDPADRARLDRVRTADPADWSVVARGPGRFADANTKAWRRYLDGANPGYPEAVLLESLAEVAWRVEQIRADHADLATVHVHHWQMLNPVVIEALLQLAFGCPVPVYNGGLLHSRLSYHDPERKRAGLPPGVAALVSGVSADRLHLELVNTSLTSPRTVLVGPGHLGDHRFTYLRHSAGQDDGEAYPGPLAYGDRPVPRPAWREIEVEADAFTVRLDPCAALRLEISTRRVPL